MEPRHIEGRIGVRGLRDGGMGHEDKIHCRGGHPHGFLGLPAAPIPPPRLLSKLGEPIEDLYYSIAMRRTAIG